MKITLNSHLLKQITAILLLGILTFTLFGYRIYFNIAEQKSTATAAAIIEEQSYSKTDLVTYKFSAKQLPYYTNDKQYEDAYGEVDVKGTVMTYVKKRIYNDSIEYVCLPNEQKTQIRNAREEFFKLVNDLNNLSNNNTSKKQSNNAKPFSFEATAFAFDDNNTQIVVSSSLRSYSVLNSNVLPNPYLQSVTPPPNVV